MIVLVVEEVITFLNISFPLCFLRYSHQSHLMKRVAFLMGRVSSHSFNICFYLMIDRVCVCVGGGKGEREGGRETEKNVFVSN